jgi:hypothetical protein
MVVFEEVVSFKISMAGKKVLPPSRAKRVMDSAEAERRTQEAELIA